MGFERFKSHYCDQIYVKTQARISHNLQLFQLEEQFQALAPAGYGKNLIYQMFVLTKNYELNGKALILVISPLKSIFEGPAAGDGITGLSYCSFLQFTRRMLFTDVNLKYWLSSTASQFVAEAAMGLFEVTAVFITQHNSTAFLILRPLGNDFN